jgi:hypothetical protein
MESANLSPERGAENSEQIVTMSSHRAFRVSGVAHCCCRRGGGGGVEGVLAAIERNGWPPTAGRH